MSRARIVPLFLACVAASGTARGQELLLNGDFENVVGSGCLSNTPNANLSNFLPTLTGFGIPSEIDVYTLACFGPPAISGSVKVALHTITLTSFDAFSFGLASPIVAGSSYSFAFQSVAVLDFDPGFGVVELGVSDVPNAFGTLVYTSTPAVAGSWTGDSGSFIAPVDGNYLTVRNGTADSWLHVDAFSLSNASQSTFCAGNGSGAPCPCGNDAPAGTAIGCLSSLGTGARLRSTGTASIGADTLVLRGDQMTNAPVLYFQGTSQLAGGAGAVFGDGLRCAAGVITRLGIETNSGGASQYPGPGDASVHVRGNVTAAGTRTYQAWYRDAAAFCTPSTFNLSNGIEIAWTL